MNGGEVANTEIGLPKFIKVGLVPTKSSDVYSTASWNVPKVLNSITFVYFVSELLVIVIFCLTKSGIKYTSTFPLEISFVQVNWYVMYPPVGF